MRRSVVGLALAALLVAATTVASVAPAAAKKASPPPSLPLCDPIDGRQCNMPFPNNFNTRTDASSPTGVRLNFLRDAMPKNVNGVTLDPSDWNLSDGFSPGSAILVQAPHLDVKQSGIVDLTDIAGSLAPDAPIVLLDTNTGKRVPYWAELDTWNTDPNTRALVIRPAVNFLEGHTIAVALRNLKDASGKRLRPPQGFRLIRSHRRIKDQALLALRAARGSDRRRASG